MVRKLVLSVVGSWWPNQSPMAVLAALLLSAYFLVLHTSFQPFKSAVCNRVQTLSLTVLSSVYLAGLILKYDAAQEVGNLGATLIVLVVMAICGCIYGALQHVRLQDKVRDAVRKEPLTGLLNKSAFDDDVKAIPEDRRACIVLNKGVLAPPVKDAT